MTGSTMPAPLAALGNPLYGSSWHRVLNKVSKNPVNEFLSI
jgi:hypothetical protein